LGGDVVKHRHFHGLYMSVWFNIDILHVYDIVVSRVVDSISNITMVMGKLS